MKNFFSVLLSLFTGLLFSQNIQVDNNTYTPQQLVEDILINSDCISNIVVTNVVGGNFNGTDQSYGYFDATGTTFPISNGLVLSTGRLSNVPGPNSSLSDDDASGWSGDNDLETALGENNTHNATLLEFDFQSVSNQISFRYLFASEEYQEGSNSTCQYSDLFGFLIRPASTATYTNIALVPGTNTPVKVTTVHSGIPGSCEPINENYFDGWNAPSYAPINFNGQTTVLTATTTIIPNETYHVKLVIADEFNYRYDSAVFLEAGSFTSDIDLGLDRLFTNRNPLCENETLDLDATQTGATGYAWFKNGLPIAGETNPAYTIVEDGMYSVAITYTTTCLTSGEISVEYATNPIINNNTILIACDLDQNGITTYNLLDAEQDIITSNTDFITNFYTSFLDAVQELDEIPNASAFENTITMQTVFARVENDYGCHAIAEVILDISNDTVTIPPFTACDNVPVDGYTDFDLNLLRTQIETQVPAGSTITFFPSEADLLAETNSIDGNYTNTIQNTETIYVLITNGSSCYAISTVNLTIDYTPVLLDNETTIYCLNNYPNTIPLEAGLATGLPEDFTYQWLLNNTATTFTDETININEIGTYTVIVTHPNGCSASRNIIVDPKEIAFVETVFVSGISPNNSVTITVSENGDYEYALNNGAYQDENVFTNVPAGEYILYIREKNGCGITEEVVYVLGFPSYFTPNGDNYNETWMPLGVNIDFKATMTIQIFDRYGKLVKQVNPQSQGFNGTFNGKDLPTSDYWYVVTFSNGKIYRGHFALKR